MGLFKGALKDPTTSGGVLYIGSQCTVHAMVNQHPKNMLSLIPSLSEPLLPYHWPSCQDCCCQSTNGEDKLCLIERLVEHIKCTRGRHTRAE